MNQDDFIFLVELLTMGKNDPYFLAALRDKPKDASIRGAYADYLEENNRPRSAELIRTTTYIPGQGRSLPGWWAGGASGVLGTTNFSSGGVRVCS